MATPICVLVDVLDSRSRSRRQCSRDFYRNTRGREARYVSDQGLGERGRDRKSRLLSEAPYPPDNTPPPTHLPPPEETCSRKGAPGTRCRLVLLRSKEKGDDTKRQDVSSASSISPPARDGAERGGGQRAPERGVGEPGSLQLKCFRPTRH